FGLTHDDIARRVGRSRVAVTNALRLLALPRDARQAVIDGQISEGHARVLLSLSTEAAQLALLREIVDRQLSVRQTEEAVRRLTRPLPPADRAAPAERERRLQPPPGTKVPLSRGKKGGRLTIHFYSDEELDALVARLR